jgi:hypothetical protein
MAIGSIDSVSYSSFLQQLPRVRNVLSQYPVQSLPDALPQATLQTEFPTQTQQSLLTQYPVQSLVTPTGGQPTVLSEYTLFADYFTQTLQSHLQPISVNNQQTIQTPTAPRSQNNFPPLNSALTPTFQQNAADQFLAQSSPQTQTLGTLLNTTV